MSIKTYVNRSKMRILFVTPPPYLPNRLHRNRSFDLIRILANKHEVHLLCLTTKKEIPEEFRGIKKVCKSVKIVYLNYIKAMLNCLRFPFLPAEVAYCYSEKVTEEIEKTVNKYDIDLLYLKRLRSAIYLMGYGNIIGIASQASPDRNDSISVILDTTDAMSMFYFRLYKQARFPKKLFYFLEAIRYKQFEKIIMKKIKNWIVCSEIDKEYLEKIGAEVNIHVVSNPVDTDYFSPLKYLSLRGAKNERRSNLKNREIASLLEVARNDTFSSLLFRGLMDKQVNIDACLFFVKEILPKVKKGIKDVKLFIVGPRPHRLIRRLHNGRDIFVTGFVKDIREYIAFTTISICPIRIASGTRFKILHAWSMGRPVVSTTIGAEGLLYKKDKNIAIGDTPKEFAKQIISLLKNRRKYDKLAENGRKTVVKHYSFKVIGQKIETLIQNVNSPERHSGNQASPEHPESPTAIRDAGQARLAGASAKQASMTGE